MKSFRKFFKHDQKGLSLIELLVAIPIIGLLGLAMGAVLIQLLHSDKISQRMLAVRQVQAAGDRVSQDAVQAQVVEFNTSIADPYDMTDPAWYLKLEWTGQWTDVDGTYNSRDVTVTYTLAPAKGKYVLQRHEVSTIIVGSTTENRDITTTAGEYLDASQMSCEWVDGSTSSFSFKVVAVVGTKTEERTYTITPRSVIADV
ncbi:MAG: prepilin-type N-terminal cleavage/methylation domain-containing protein [Dehalococcoidia bacterium]|nr:prepilin-type N-terminal cleavage/methylation domain-containing protein [Dehalococcoidia bacterium]